MDQDLEEAVVLLNVCTTLFLMQRRRQRRFRSVGVLPLWRRRRDLGDGHQLIQELRFNTVMFFKYTRMNYERFDYLLGLCAPLLQKRQMATTISPQQRLAMTLRYLATGDSMQSMSLAYRCGFSTVSVIIRETVTVIVHVLHRLAVCEPRSKEAWKAVAQAFWKRWNLPHCLGAIDGRHMQIRAPKHSGSLFVNYKKTHSINLLAVAAADYTFITADVGAEGSVNDATALNNSEFWERVRSGTFHIPEAEFLPHSSRMMDFFFVGDGIFQLQQHLMKPFAVRKLTQEEAILNYRLSRARRVVENAFGILVARWRIFRSPLTTNLDTAEDIVLACICLHNFIMRSRAEGVVEEYNPPMFVDVELPDGTLTPGKWREMVVDESGTLARFQQVPRRSSVKASAMRKELMAYLNNEGSVTWQVERVRKGFWGAHITEDVVEANAARTTEEAVDDVRAMLQ